MQKKKFDNIKKINVDKKYLIITIVIILVISAIISVIVIVNKPNYEEYTKYEEKINTYGFNIMYDNESAYTQENVTKSEALKMVISTMLNTTDISKMSVVEGSTYKNSEFVEYAKAMGIISDDEINQNNAQDTVKYGELLMYIENSKKLILKLNPVTDSEVNIKNFEKLSADMQIIVRDLVANEIIPNNKDKIKLNKKVFKGMLNQILINIAEKFNTITVGDNKLNINPDKVPVNQDQYPYILSNVDKQIYEYNFFTVNDEYFMNPKEAYLEKKEVYSSIEGRINNYYNLILNVDYENINFENFYSELITYLTMKPNEEKVKEYVEYVKNNKIKLSGNAKACLPIVYLDGEKYRVRTSISFKVESANVKDNLLVFDAYSNGNFEYTKDSYNIIVDTKMLTGYQFDSLYIYPGEFITSIVDGTNSIKKK